MEPNGSSWRWKQKVAFKYQVLDDDDDDDVVSWDLALRSLVHKYWHYWSINTWDRSLFMDNLLTVLKWQPCGMCGNILWCHTPEEELTSCMSGEWGALYCKYVLSITLSNRIHSVPQTAVICQKCGHLLTENETWAYGYNKISVIKMEDTAMNSAIKKLWPVQTIMKTLIAFIDAQGLVRHKFLPQSQNVRLFT
jgi:hypothetical protein